MATILSSYISLILLFTISFSSTRTYEIQTRLLENESVPPVSQLNFNDSRFLIYPSSDNFKNYILPFLSSEKLLKIYFHFLNLYPNVSIKKFLPGSTLTVTVHDFPNSCSGYIFENEFSSFNPIIFNFEQNYRIVFIRNRHDNTEEDPIYVLYSLSNEIDWLQPLVLPNGQQVVAALDGQTNSFFVASTVIKACGTIPQRWNINDPFPEYLDCVLHACQLNCFQKIYFKIWDISFKYEKFFWIPCLPLLNYIKDYIKESHTEGCKQFCYAVILKVVQYIFHFFIYHAQMIPFYILSIPFGYFLLEEDTSNVVYYFTIITKYFVYFCTIPSGLHLIFSLVYYRLESFLHDAPPSENGEPERIQIKPQEISWPVTCLLMQKYKDDSLCYKAYFFGFMFVALFWMGFYYSLPLSYFMMIKGEY